MRSIVRDKILSILITRRCTAACRHCGSFSSPRATDTLSESVVRDSIDQAARLGFKLIAFTGGESTLEWDTLSMGVLRANGHGIRTRLVTNGHWATSRAEAARVIHDFKSWGLDELNVSTGDEHIRFVPLETVINSIAEAVTAGYPIQVMVEYRAKRMVTKQMILNHPTIRKLPINLAEQIEITESPWMPLSPMRIGSYDSGDTVVSNNVALRNGCKSVLQTYTVEPDGRVAACCGLGVKLIPELAVSEVSTSSFLEKAVEAAENDFLKLWLRYVGPEKILAWAARKSSNIQWEGMYAHNCQACHRVYRDEQVRKIVQDNYKEVVEDVALNIIFDEGIYPAAVQAHVKANEDRKTGAGAL